MKTHQTFIEQYTSQYPKNKIPLQISTNRKLRDIFLPWARYSTNLKWKYLAKISVPCVFVWERLQRLGKREMLKGVYSKSGISHRTCRIWIPTITSLGQFDWLYLIPFSNQNRLSMTYLKQSSWSIADWLDLILVMVDVRRQSWVFLIEEEIAMVIGRG